MKRNIVPLLGIAVVVAILSTAVFYGLFAGKLRSSSPEALGQPIVVAAKDLERGAVLQASDLKISQFRGTLAGSYSSTDQLVGATLIAAVKQNEPLFDERVISKAGRPGSPDGSVPAGMRAISVRISESDGLIALLKPGARVDLQAVQDRNGGPELRTILQNVEIVAVSPQTQPAGGNRGPVSIVTVLARPDDADVLALADSGTRMRLSLRNPLDTNAGARRSMLLASVFQSNGAPAASPARVATAESRTVEIDMQVLRASAAAASQLESKVDHASTGNSIVVAPFAAGVDSRELIQKLAAQHDVEILSERSLTASTGNSARFRTGPASGKLGIAFFTAAGKDGKLNLRVQPEISAQTRNGMETRMFDADLPATGSFLVTGLLNEARDRETLEHLYPGHRWTDGRLIIVATSHEGAAHELSAIHRGR